MEPRAATIDPDELLRHAEWMRGLACALVGDASTAEDAVQDAWIAALHPDHRRRGALRPWLRGVLRRTLRQRRREEERRAHRQAAAARAESLPSTAELVERAELQERVAQAVVALPEPYRTVVLLRYFEGLSAVAIAERRRLTAGTVRSQLKRGLDLLRERLDAHHDGRREQWLGILFGFLPPRPSPPPPLGGIPLLGGALVMSKSAVLIVAAILAVPVLFGVYWIASGASDPAGPTSSPLGEAVVEAAEPEALAPARRQEDRGREAVAFDAPLPEATAPADVVVDLVAHIKARITDSEGVPLPGAILRIIDEKQERETNAGADGVVALTFLLPAAEHRTEFEASAPARETKRFAAVLHPGPMPLGDIVLRPGGALEGRVEDAEGRPVADARVQVTEMENLRTDPEALRRHGPLTVAEYPSTRTDAGGRFLLEGIADGTRIVWAGAPGRSWDSSPPLEVRWGETIEGLVLVLEELRDDDTIEGIVLSPEGEPVANAHLQGIWATARAMSSTPAKSDEHGRFRLLVEHRVPHDFVVEDDGDRWSPIELADISPGTHDVEFRFLPAQEIELEVIDREGDPVETFEATTAAAEESAYARWETVELGEHFAGIARLRAPNHDFTVEVKAPGYQRALLGPFSAVAPPERVAVPLEPSAAVCGVVLLEGEPYPGARVELRHQVEGISFQMNGYPTVYHPNPAAMTESGEDGAFAITPPTSGEFLLRATATGHAPAELGPIPVDLSRGRSDLRLVLGAGGTIEGRVHTAPGHDPAGLIVGLNHGLGEPRTVRVGADGTYRFEDLACGLWRVELREEELGVDHRSRISINEGSDPEEIAWNCEVFAGEVTHFDLVAGSVELATLDGRLDLDGADATGWTAHVFQDRGGLVERKQEELSRDGRFRLEEVTPGIHELKLVRSTPGGGRLEIVERIDFTPGVTPWRLRLRPASVTGEGIPVTTGVEVSHRLVSRPEDAAAHPRLRCRVRITPDAAGRFAVPWIPAGRIELQRFDPNADPDGWETRETVDLKPGETRHLGLR